jgi:hypothetical protein
MFLPSYGPGQEFSHRVWLPADGLPEFSGSGSAGRLRRSRTLAVLLPSWARRAAILPVLALLSRLGAVFGPGRPFFTDLALAGATPGFCGRTVGFLGGLWLRNRAGGGLEAVVFHHTLRVLVARVLAEVEGELASGLARISAAPPGRCRLQNCVPSSPLGVAGLASPISCIR